MDLLTFHLDQVNWLAVVVATVAGFALGSLWYSTMLFGKPWMKLVGIKPKDMKSANATRAYVGVGFLAFVLATAMGVLMSALVFDTWMQGLVLGVLVSVVFSAVPRAIHLLFERRSKRLFLINAGYDLVFLALAGVIIGLF